MGSLGILSSPKRGALRLLERFLSNLWLGATFFANFSKVDVDFDGVLY
jgi:hypothetical protein